MKMREEHMVAFRQAAMADFEDRMWAHLVEFFPEQCGMLGEGKTRGLVMEGTAKAMRYGIVAERDVCKFIDLMFAFGRDFDVSPQTPWAERILADGRLKDPTAKVDRLYSFGTNNIRTEIAHMDVESLDAVWQATHSGDRGAC